MTKDTGGQAFPSQRLRNVFLDDGGNVHSIYDAENGMTLRDWFASQALPSAMGQYGPPRAAEMAYAYADAMLAARQS